MDFKEPLYSLPQIPNLKDYMLNDALFNTFIHSDCPIDKFLCDQLKDLNELNSVNFHSESQNVVTFSSNVQPLYQTQDIAPVVSTSIILSVVLIAFAVILIR